MAFDTSQADTDLKNLIDDAGLGASMTFGGASYACSITDRQTTDDNEVGGFVPEYDFDVSVRIALFSGVAAPNTGKTITVSGIEYRIENRLITADGNEYQLGVMAV